MLIDMFCALLQRCLEECLRLAKDIGGCFIDEAGSESNLMKKLNMDIKSLVECPGWDSPDGIEKVTTVNINAGEVEGFILLQER